MRKCIFSVILVSTLLGGCDYLASYSTQVRQGNIIEARDVVQIRKGMTKEQVAHIMGTPVLENTFDNDRWLYVYTNKKGRKPLIYQKFIVVFSQGRVVNTEDGVERVEKW